MPFKSLSGALRTGIGLAKSRLNKSLQHGMVLLGETVPKSVDNTQNLLQRIWQLLPRMETQIEVLTDDKQQWMELIYGIEDDDSRTAEEKLFNETAYSGDGFMTVVWDAKETVSLLKSLAGRLELSQSTPAAEATTATNTVTPSIQASDAVRAAPKTSAKLPKLQLPKFSGDYLEWDQFWQMFRVNVHETSLSKVEKFAYLQGQLTGPALGAVQGIAVSEDNYDVAVAHLQSRYERQPRQLISSYYSQLKRLGQSPNKVSELQKTYDACERIFRLLEQAGEDLGMNQSLVLDVFSKYPNQVVERLFSRRGISATSTLSDVRKALADHIKEAESLSEIFEELKPFVPAKSEKPSNQASGTSTSAIPHSSALTSADVEKQKPQPTDRRVNDTPKSSCYFCSGSHFNSGCEKYATTDARLQRLKSLGRCTRCLSSTHTEDGCRTPAKTITCFFCRQSGSHRSPLCPERFSPKSPQPATLVSAETINSQSSAISKVQRNVEPSLLNAGESSLLLTALTTVSNPKTGQSMNARLLFDTGSHRTYITESCSKQLSSTAGCQDTITVATFGSKRTLSVQSSQVEVSVKQRDGSFKLLRANTTPLIAAGSIIPDCLPQAAAGWLEAMRSELADDYTIKTGDIDILVGTDYFWDFITGSKITTSFGINLIPSTLGLLLTGKYHDEHKQTPATLLCLTETRSPIMGLDSVEAKFPATYPDIDNFWELERIGISDDPTENDDAKALDHFNKTVYLKDGRYHVAWPWRPEVSDLPTNYQLALGRFRSLAKRLGSNPEIKEKYNQVIEQQVSLGIIEKVQVNTPSSKRNDHPIHYLPHHPVVRPGSATTKLRIVYDASSKSRKDQKSLNECLFRGPVILPDLCGQLIRFRLNDIAIVADIQKAFLQMALQPNDRDVTRFLWFADPTIESLDGNIVTYRFCRVPFGVISSPSLLCSTVQHHLRDWNTQTAELIRRNIYVDNALCTLNDEKLVKPFYDEAKAIFQAAGMNLTEWSSNYSSIEQIIPEDDRCSSNKTKVLGIQWDSNTDVLRLKEPAPLQKEIISKRTVLKFIAAIFDPLGWFQPASLPAKCFLKTLWQQSRGWDEALPDELCQRWASLYDELKDIFSIELPRKLGRVSSDSQIVVFCDASAEAYSATAYLRSPSVAGYTSTLLIAKSRLAPKGSSGDPISIPRLELLGLTIAARLTRFVRTSLEVELPAVIFCDSMVVLGWLRSTKLLTVFVSNRINTIKKLENVQFRYVKSNENPADLGTRGMSAGLLGDCKLWWHGPQWLESEQSAWPTDLSITEDFEAVSSPESGCKNKQIFHSFVAAEVPMPVGNGTNESFLGIDATSFSSFRRLLRVSVVCLKILKTLVWDKLSRDSQQGRWSQLAATFRQVESTNSVTASELAVVKSFWVMSAQSEAFHELKLCMETGRRHPLSRQLDTTLDNNGIIRCMGRYEHADLPDDAIRPILLPRDHVVTRLIIQEIHQRLFHSGVSHTLTQLRRQFWVTRGRAVVRREITQNCQICKKFKGPHFPFPVCRPGHGSGFRARSLSNLWG